MVSADKWQIWFHQTLEMHYNHLIEWFLMPRLCLKSSVFHFRLGLCLDCCCCRYFRVQHHHVKVESDTRVWRGSRQQISSLFDACKSLVYSTLLVFVLCVGYYSSVPHDNGHFWRIHESLSVFDCWRALEYCCWSNIHCVDVSSPSKCYPAAFAVQNWIANCDFVLPRNTSLHVISSNLPSHPTDSSKTCI